MWSYWMLGTLVGLAWSGFTLQRLGSTPERIATLLAVFLVALTVAAVYGMLSRSERPNAGRVFFGTVLLCQFVVNLLLRAL